MSGGGGCHFVLSNETGLLTQTDGPMFRAEGTSLNFQGMIHNISGTGALLTLQLWGAVDGKIFRQIGGAPNRGTFGPLPPGVNTGIQIIHFFIRAIFSTTAPATGVVEFSVTWTGFDS